MKQMHASLLDTATEEEVYILRKEIIESLHVTGGGHYGGSLSVIDVILVLYRKILRVSPAQPLLPDRDRFILSKGHAAIAYYAVLKWMGFVHEPLNSYGQFDSPYEGHPDMHQLPGIDFSTGSLGQGLAVGVGMAFALRSSGARVWVVLGDGECQEGQVWETAMIAHRYQLDNLTAIIDVNGYQEWGWSYDPTLCNDPVIQMRQKWEAFGWQVLETNGHDHICLEESFERACLIKGSPSVILAHTVKGKGFPLAEADPQRFHCTTLTADELKQQENIL